MAAAPMRWPHRRKSGDCRVQRRRAGGADGFGHGMWHTAAYSDGNGRGRGRDSTRPRHSMHDEACEIVKLMLAIASELGEEKRSSYSFLPLTPQHIAHNGLSTLQLILTYGGI